jgi:hypothetical protein
VADPAAAAAGRAAEAVEGRGLVQAVAGHDTCGGTVLLDVKTVLSVQDPDRVGRWLWQLLGYAWLDPTDRYAIRAVGIYLVHHGVLVTWPIGHLATALLAPPGGTASAGHDVAAAAVEFRRLVDHIVAAETRHPTAHLATRPPAQDQHVRR